MKGPKLPKMSATFAVVTPNRLFRSEPILRKSRYQNPRETADATRVKLCAETQRYIAQHPDMYGTDARAKLLSWTLV